MNGRSARFASAISLVVGVTVSAASAQAEERSLCNQSAGAVAFIDLPGHPFAAVASADGCAIFVSLIGDTPDAGNRIAVLRRAGGKVFIDHRIGDADIPYGMTLTHDGKLLILANNGGVAVLDVERAISGKENPLLGYIQEPGNANPTSISVTLTGNDRFLFVADETAGGITVINLKAARDANFASSGIVGRIPAGFAPIAMAFSRDERVLYATVQQTPLSDHWPAACKPEGENPATARFEDPEGAVVAIDARRAQSDPEHAVIARIPAGCVPVRLARSPKGDRLYVTARGEDALIVFDTARLVADPDHARLASVPVGTSPVGIAVIDEGRKLAIANSDRFSLGTSGREAISIVDAAKAESGEPALIGTIRPGVFPRELSVTADGNTLLVTNSDSDQLELIDLQQIPK